QEASGYGSQFSIRVSDSVAGGARELTDLVLPVPGRYNIQNALAAFAVAAEVGVPDDKIREALASFGGVKRRFTFTGTWNGVDFFDDYAHHPVEISAVLDAARRTTSGRVIAIVQPHRYSRLHDLFDDFCSCFSAADAVLVAPVFAAGEELIPGADHRALVEGIRRNGKNDAIAVESPADLGPILARFAQPGDVVLGLGAGTVTEWSHALPHELNAMRQVVGGAG
ncbi:MAG: cyanophycin synthetase, partial [Pseudomonadota bacterium]